MKGQVKQIVEKKTKDGKQYWTLLVGKDSYSVFDQKYIEGLKAGDPVEYNWSSSGRFKNITGLKKLEPGQELDEPFEPNYRDRRIVRMACLKYATALTDGSKLEVKNKGAVVHDVAKDFEKYILGEEKAEEDPVEV